MPTSRDDRQLTTENALSGAVSGQVVQAGTIGELHFHTEAATQTVPAQLPAVPGWFASRDHELRDLSQWLARSSDQVLVVISGPGGVGKTALALRWLHDHRVHYPGGQLYVDLGGFSLVDPVSPTEVLEWFLLALGVAAEAVPTGLPQREALYRSITADRSVVVLLDDAASAAQVRPLLPASQHSVVVVTSRWRLTGLAMVGARFVDVAPMDVTGSMDLLRQAVDQERIMAEPDAMREIAELCDGLPLALSLVGARLSTHPRRRLSREVADLRTEQHRLAVLRVGDSSVAAVFDLSYRSVPPAARRLYRLVSLHVGSRFGVDVAAVAVDATVEETEALLDILVEANLLSEVDDRRYQFHDLVRLHARQQADDDADAAVRRMVEWYLDTTVAADLLVHPLPARVGPRYQGNRPASPLFDAGADALAWLSGEHTNIRAALFEADRRTWDELTWQFCEALWGYFRHDRRYDDWIAMYRVGIPAAQRCGHRLAEARLRGRLGYAYAKLRRFDDAITETNAELAIVTAEGDRQGTASAFSQLGRVARDRGDLGGALRYYEQARDLQAELGNRRGVALSRRRIGQVLTALGRFEDAIGELIDAADTMAALGDRTQYARTLMFLGAAYAKSADPRRAAAPLDDALTLMRELGSAYYQGEILSVLGDVAERSGRPAAARSYFRQAREHYLAAGDAQADRLLDRIDRLADAQDEPPSGV